MTLNEYCEYIRNPLAVARARVVTIPPGEGWTTLRRFHQERGDLELRISDLVSENAWLPMPDEIFERVSHSIQAQDSYGKVVILLGIPGYLTLLTEENKRLAIVALHKFVNDTLMKNTVCLLQSDFSTKMMLEDVFANPRYRLGKQLIDIDTQYKFQKEENEDNAGLTEVMLVGEDLASFIPEVSDTFHKYLRYIEEYPNDNSIRRIVVASEGRELAGVSADVRQVVCLRDFARVFFDVEDAGLSEDALRWLCEMGKECSEKSLMEKVLSMFFPEREVAKRILYVFDRCKDTQREVLMWLIRQVSSKESYLYCIVKQQEVVVDNFRSAYVTGANEWLDESAMYSDERMDAVKAAGAATYAAYIRQFILRCTSESTSRVAPWLNCGTREERAELLRRCALDGVVSQVVKRVYAETLAYLNSDHVFCEVALDDYFREYRELKMANRVTPEFYKKAARAMSLISVEKRDTFIQRCASDSNCALLVVDAMGAEWLPMLVAMARERNLGIESIAVGEARLPTMTQFNSIHWPDTTRRLPDMKRFDNIAHNGVEMHETRPAEENLLTELDVVSSELFQRVELGLVSFKRVLVTADHGSSRLAALAWQSEPKLARTLACEEGAEIADWRYRERAAHGDCPPELEETLDGKYWVVRGYDRLPKKGGGQGFELHGGATLEERLVPVVVFSLTGQFIPMAKAGEKRAQIVEKDDFDL